MKRRRRKILHLFMIVMAIFIVGVGVYKIYNSYEQNKGGITVSRESNSIAFDSKFKWFLMNLDIEDNENREILDRGISYKIINPKGDIEEEGILSSKDTIKNEYNDSKGTWKVEFELQDEESIMINFKCTSSTLKLNL